MRRRPTQLQTCFYAPRRDAPEILPDLSPFCKRGRGECRVPNAPAASCALGVVSMRTSIHSGGTGNIRHSPRNGFTAYSALFPGTTALLTPSSARRVGVLANLTPASGRQNHTASPSATESARLTLRRVHRIPPHVRDDRETPLLARRDGESKPHISEKRKTKYFCERAGQEFADPARRANQSARARSQRLPNDQPSNRRPRRSRGKRAIKTPKPGLAQFLTL